MPSMHGVRVPAMSGWRPSGLPESTHRAPYRVSGELLDRDQDHEFTGAPAVTVARLEPFTLAMSGRLLCE